MNSFSATWNAGFHFVYSDYDPALIQSLPPGDIHLFWIDWRFQRKNLNPAQAVECLQGRVAALRERDFSPLRANNWLAAEEDGWAQELNRVLDSAFSSLPDAALADLWPIQGLLGAGLWDERNDEISH
jgi:hypothetical protein